MIMTITLNPAIDKTVVIDGFKAGAVNRISSVRLDAGGKGINVSKIIKVLGGESKAFGILAGNSGRYIMNYLDSCKIENDFLFIDGETRTNIKVVDNENQTNTDINEPGPQVSLKDIGRLEDRIFSGIDKNAILVLCGSIPSNVSTDIYKRWILRAKEYGARVILDADGPLLKEGIEAGPDYIKPNIHELERLVNKKLESISDAADAAKGLQKNGIKAVVVSLGDKGALFITRKDVIHAEGIEVHVKSTVGAGDSMVAALAYVLDKGYPFERAITLSIASSAAKVATWGSQPPEFRDILEYEKKVRYRYI